MKDIEKQLYFKLLLEYPRTLNDDLLKEFSKNYNILKESGLTPNQIKHIIKKYVKICDTTYYKYLKLSREVGFITDSFEENKRKMLERIKSNISLQKNVTIVVNNKEEKKESFLGKILKLFRRK